MRAALAATLVAVAGLGACGGPKGQAARPVAGRPVADPAAALLAHVPASASFVFVRDQHASINDQFNDTGRIRDGLRSAGEQIDRTPGTGQAFAAALIDELVGTREPSQVTGWREGQSVLVMYGLGFDTVVRASLDGVALRATLERAAEASGFALTATVDHGRSYYRIEIPTPAFTFWLVFALDDHGVAAAITGDPERMAEHLLADRPTEPPLDTAAVVASAYPDGRKGARFSGALYPDRFAGALSSLLMREPAWLAPVEPCVATLVGLLRATPAITFAWVPGRERFDATIVIDATDDTIDRLGRGQRALPHWPTDQRHLRVGLGVPPTTLGAVLEPWFTALDTTSDACGSNGMMTAMLRNMISIGPAAQVATAVIQVAPGNEGFAAVVGARDLQALWAGMRGMLPMLRPQPPAPAERLSLPGVVIVGGADTLGVGMGDGGPAEVASLMAAEPGLPSVLSFELGRDFVEAFKRTAAGAPGPFEDLQFGSFAMRTYVRGHQLVLDMTAVPPASRQLAR